MVGRFHGMHSICETSQICYLMGRRPMRDVFGYHVKYQSFHLVHRLRSAPFKRKTSQESINLETKSYLDCSSDTLCTRGEFGRVTFWLQTLRSWKRWTHQKSTLKDSTQRKSYFPKKMKHFVFSSRRWTKKFYWWRSRIENIHLDTGPPNSRRRSDGFS